MNKITEPAGQILQTLADSLGVASEVLWEALLKQAFIQGITSTVWAVFWVVITILLLKVIRPLFKKNSLNYILTDDEKASIKEEYKKDYSNNYSLSHAERIVREKRNWLIAGSWGCVGLSVMTISLMLSLLNKALIYFVNPQYWAIQEIFKAMGN